MIQRAPNPEDGLSLEEVQKRLTEYGYNEVPERRESQIVRFLRKFWGFTPWMLEVTVALTWLLGKYLETGVIAALLLFNGVLGFFQEEKANSAVDLLKQRLKVNARVKRDGKWIRVSARELVLGDAVRLRAGDFVPADVRIAEGNVEVDQSSLTGESLAVEKKPSDILLSGSVISRGETTAIVVSTGAKTYYGRTVELVQVAKPKLHMQEAISKVVRWLLLMVSLLLSTGLVLAILKGMVLIEILPLAVILLVSAIPVALPTMFTVSMALGSLELAKKGVLVTRLDASEDAATMDTLCVDKTGTITMNTLSLIDAIALEGYSKEDVILYGALASQEANQDPIDLAFISAAKDLRISIDDYLQTAFVPFDPSTRRTESIVEKEGSRFVVFKGAINVLINLSRNSQEEFMYIEKKAEELSVKGYRTIAVSKGTTEHDAKIVGIAALSDKPRPDSSRLIARLRDLGVSVKMLTGDALPIAKEMAIQVGLGEGITTIWSVRDSVKEGKHLERVEASDGFAEIYPEDKYLIVKSLQKKGHIVGMTGDGVNDAPALRQAEVGIAVSSATDVAKQSSSAVLTTGGLIGIVDLVITGRMIHQRIDTWIINKIIRTFKRLAFIVIAFILLGQYVVSTLHMTLLLFLSDYVTLSLATDRVSYSEKPDSWDITGLVRVGVLLGTLLVIESLLLLYIGILRFGLGDSIEQLRTFVFNFLVFSGYFTVIAVRERRHFWKSMPSKPLSLAMILNSIIISLVSIVGAPGLASITPLEVLTVLTYSFVTCLLLNDFAKVFIVERMGARL
ncbi:MAG: plasma-membrane proton-efflux P-type ATPase [archaeon]